MIPLITIRNKPKVITVTGIVRMIKRGFKETLSKAMKSIKISNADKSEIRTKVKYFESKYMTKADSIHLSINLIFLFVLCLLNKFYHFLLPTNTNQLRIEYTHPL